jgi:putative transposase
MQRKKYTEEQIIQVLKEGEAGAPVADLCRKHGMSDASYYNWKAKYADRERTEDAESTGRRKPAS